MIHIRTAGTLDAGPMAELLSAIIARGDTTALTEPVTRDTVAGWMNTDPDRSAWHLAEDSGGQIAGFQWIAPHPLLPPEACDVATFVRIGQTGLGIGSRLFDATRTAAKRLGYIWINATIRADNAGGLAYYQSRGFETYTHDRDQPLGDGRRVDKISKRYDL
jgi:Sortase and related acyltransferases